MKVLITGSGGFVGGHLARRLLLRGHRVAGMDKKSGESTADFGTLSSYVKFLEPNMIVHLGANCSTAVSLRNPEVDFEDNVVGTFNVCEAARRGGNIPILFTSSCKVNPGGDNKLTPLGASKRAGEEYLRTYEETYGLPFAINQPSTVYGPGQDGTSDSGWFTWFIKAALTGQLLEITGDGSQSRDVLYIQDFIDLLVDQIENFSLYSGNTYPVGGGFNNEVSLNDLLETLRYSNIRYVPRLLGDLDRVVNDNWSVGEVNGWMPVTSWLAGLELTRRSMV